MTKRTLAIGWPLLPLPDADGTLAYPSDLDSSVRQAMRVILSTRPGELLLHPEFGAGLDLFLHDLDTVALRRSIHDRILESLKRWEPRIDVDRVDVLGIPGEPGKLRIEIVYRLRRTGVPDSLGFTLSTGT